MAPCSAGARLSFLRRKRLNGLSFEKVTPPLSNESYETSENFGHLSKTEHIELKQASQMQSTGCVRSEAGRVKNSAAQRFGWTED